MIRYCGLKSAEQIFGWRVSVYDFLARSSTRSVIAWGSTALGAAPGVPSIL